MKRLKTFLILVAVLLSKSAADLSVIAENFRPDEQMTANPAVMSNQDDSGSPTDGELGIIGTLAGIYGKGREAVKAVYDEVQYWKGIAATYDRLKDWYAQQRAKYQAIRRTVGKLTHNPREVFANRDGKDWFETLLNTIESPLIFVQHYTGNAERLVNQTDDFAYSGLRNLDRIFYRAERYFDALGDSKISGMLMPSTEEIFNNFDEVIFASNLSETSKRRIMNEANFRRFSETGHHNLSRENFDLQQEAKIAEMEAFASANNALLSAAGAQNFPETQIITVIQGLTASAVSNSAMYYEWAMNSMNNLSKQMQEVDKMFAENKLDNIMDLQLLAAKLELEMINANNKRILHELEALKVHHALLGYEIWEHSRKKATDEVATADALTLRQTVLDGLNDVQDSLYKRRGDRNYSVRHRGIFQTGR